MLLCGWGMRVMELAVVMQSRYRSCEVDSTMMVKNQVWQRSGYTTLAGSYTSVTEPVVVAVVVSDVEDSVDVIWGPWQMYCMAPDASPADPSPNKRRVSGKNAQLKGELTTLDTVPDKASRGTPKQVAESLISE
jgi:hypothetical protein